MKGFKNRPFQRELNPVRAIEVAKSISPLCWEYNDRDGEFYFGQDNDDAVVTYIIKYPTKAVVTEIILLTEGD